VKVPKSLKKVKIGPRDESDVANDHHELSIHDLNDSIILENEDAEIHYFETTLRVGARASGLPCISTEFSGSARKQYRQALDGLESIYHAHEKLLWEKCTLLTCIQSARTHNRSYICRARPGSSGVSIVMMDTQGYL